MEPSEYHNIARVEDTHWWYTGMAAAAAGWLRGLPLEGPRSRAEGAAAGPRRPVLDAGCGTGGGLRWLTEFGRAIGLDWHPLALRLAREKGYNSLARADVQQLPFAAGSFSLVTSFDVLYHLQVNDDRRALAEFARVLAPGGWLLLRLPAHKWMRRGHDRAVHTRHRYAREEVRAKVAAAGLMPVRVSYANALLLLPALLWRLAQRDAGGGTDVRLPAPAVNALLGGWLRAEAAWLRHLDLPIGLSVMALARKPEK
jgi:SAM-dependent methyltransferase